MTAPAAGDGSGERHAPGRQLIKKRRRGLHIAHEAGVIERAGSRP